MLKLINILCKPKFSDTVTTLIISVGKSEFYGVFKPPLRFFCKLLLRCCKVFQNIQSKNLLVQLCSEKPSTAVKENLQGAPDFGGSVIGASLSHSTSFESGAYESEVIPGQ